MFTWKAVFVLGELSVLVSWAWVKAPLPELGGESVCLEQEIKLVLERGKCMLQRQQECPYK